MAKAKLAFYSKASGSEEIRFETEAEVKTRNGRYFIQYFDPSDGMNGIKTSILVVPAENSITIKRPHPLAASLTIQKNIRQLSEYGSSAGILLIETEATRMDFKITEQGLYLDVNYHLYYKDEPLETIVLTMKIQVV